MFHICKYVSKHVILVCFAMIFCSCHLARADHHETTGHFSVVQDDGGKFWFYDSRTDTKFLSTGINHVVEVHDFQAPPNTTYYDAVNTAFDGDHDAWKKSTASILKDHNFNTYGGWSSPIVNTGELYETPVLYVAGHAPERVLFGLSPRLEELMETAFAENWEPIKHKDKVLGVFLDNEMSWYGRSPWDNNPRYTMLEHAFAIEETDERVEAKNIVLDFLQKRYSSIEDFATAWELNVSSWDDLNSNNLRSSGTEAAMKDREDLITLAADSFFKRTTEFVRERIPGVLILGTRFAGDAPLPVMRATGVYCDVVSVNHYTPRPEVSESLITEYWLNTKKPIMITEYSWRAEENTSGNPNSGGAGSVVRTQKDRGENYVQFVEDAYKWPMIIGMHWFEFSDQSPQGRFDGENSNYGVVDIYHRPYEDLLNLMETMNARVDEVHANSTRAIPTQMPEPPKALVEIGQFPGRPAVINLLEEPPAMELGTFNADDASVEITPADQGINLLIDTGTTWGCGIAVFGPADWKIPGAAEWATNLDGYSQIEIEIEAEASVPFMLAIDEAGVASPNAPEYDKRAGDDGESFAFETVTLKEGNNTLVYNLVDLSPRGVWGNQLGNRRVDVQALRSLSLVFTPGPSPTNLNLKSVTLKK